MSIVSYIFSRSNIFITTSHVILKKNISVALKCPSRRYFRQVRLINNCKCQKLNCNFPCEVLWKFIIINKCQQYVKLRNYLELFRQKSFRQNSSHKHTYFAKKNRKCFFTNKCWKKQSLVLGFTPESNHKTKWFISKPTYVYHANQAWPRNAI